MEPNGFVELEGASAAAIQDAAKRMWASLAAGSIPEDGIATGTAIMQACVGNLVVVLDSEEELGKCTERIGAVAQTHPVRSIFLYPDKELAAGQVKTTVSALCTMASPRGTHLCAERIIMAAATDMLDRLHQTILGLMVEDLPRIVWWHRRSIATSTLWHQLAMHVDHVIVDTRHLQAGPGGLAAMVQSMHEAGDTCVSDINWGRITPWREMTAQFFDLPERRSLLSRIVNVTVTVARPPEEEMPTSALLYVAWLADRLEWKDPHMLSASDADCLSRVCWTDTAGNGVETRIVYTDCPGHGHLLARVEIETHGIRGSRFTLVRTCDMRTAVASVRIEDGEPVTKVVSLDPMPAHVLISNELSYPGRDHGYEQALHVAATLMEGPR